MATLQGELQGDRTPLSDRREQAFAELRAAMPEVNFAAALRCAVRLRDALPHPHRLEDNLVLVAFGGGKDSAYMTAFVRAMQLMLHRIHDTTFRMRVASMRHAGMPRPVMENIDRVYRALHLHEDPDCELLLIDGDEVSTFDVDSPQRDHVVRRNRLDILMTGHRTFADGRPTFCNACNFSVANSFGLAASHGGGADVIITGDSENEQNQYARWITRLGRRLAPAARGADRGTTIVRILSDVDRIAQSYFADIHGGDATALAERHVASAVPAHLRFFSIYEDTHYEAGDHMEMLTGFLGFEFDDVAFSFTESDCGNPALMAHLRGLKCERVFGRPYEEGLAEYVDFALGLMRKKHIPEPLIEQMRARYAGSDAVSRMRQAADEYALETFGLTEEQLVCMVHSPFAGEGAGLEELLAREHPALAERAVEIHALLAAPASDQANDASANEAAKLANELERISGLELAQLRVLYRSPLHRPTSDGRGAGVIDAVLADDPHKAVITTRHAPTGPDMLEQISGR
ncbi:MAG: PqqD family protein [Frankiaceae bacterium]